jgi:hypothetical protein
METKKLSAKAQSEFENNVVRQSGSPNCWVSAASEQVRASLGPYVRLGVLLLALVVNPTTAFSAEEPTQADHSSSVAQPRIRFDSLTYDFGEILAGEPVKHVFTFTNTGSQDLVITKVQPGCGCTTAGDWTRLTKPGEVGVVPIQLNTAGLNGSADKTVSLSCNDPSQQIVTLKLVGKARKAFEITPSVAILQLLPDSPFGAATVRITNRLDQPLLIFSLESTNTAFSVVLRTNVFGQEYTASISNNMPLPSGATMATVALKTSLSNLQTIRLLTMAIAFPTFSVEPKQINLPAEPLIANQEAYVTILNNSTNPVTLSNPRTDAPGVSVTLKEIKPGKVFNATLSFPAGFHLAAGEMSFLRVQTSHPLCPVVQVPLLQVSDPLPVAPILTNKGPEMMTARLPLIFQTKALESLNLGPEPLSDIKALKTQFIEQIGGLSQDPSDPAYLARWQNARSKVDASLPQVIGQSALVGFDTSGDLPEASSR